MANDTTSNERFWSFTTATGGTIAAAGTWVYVRKVVFFPGAVNDDIIIQEYNPAGTAVSAIVLKANNTDINPIALDFGPACRKLNGFVLNTIDAGTLNVYIGKY